MRPCLTLFVVAGALVAGSQQVLTHHSFAATYKSDERVSVEGELVQILFRNPHSFVYVATGEKNTEGNLIRWAIEWGGTGQLGSQGVTRDTLKVGDRVIITGNPGHNPSEHRIRMLMVRRPKDGFTWGARADEVVD
jgi:hypothetical protein